MYLIVNWVWIQKIENPDLENPLMTYAFMLPNFNTTDFPFIAVCGAECLSLVNVVNRTVKPFVMQSFYGLPGLQAAFIKTEQSEFDMSLHFAGRVQDNDGSGRELIQYSYINLKQDIFEWLKINGNLPAITIDEYLEEAKALQRLKNENLANKALIEKKDSAYKLLIEDICKKETKIVAILNENSEMAAQLQAMYQ